MAASFVRQRTVAVVCFMSALLLICSVASALPTFRSHATSGKHQQRSRVDPKTVHLQRPPSSHATDDILALSSSWKDGFAAPAIDRHSSVSLHHLKNLLASQHPWYTEENPYADDYLLPAPEQPMTTAANAGIKKRAVQSAVQSNLRPLYSGSFFSQMVRVPWPTPTVQIGSSSSGGAINVLTFNLPPFFQTPSGSNESVPSNLVQPPAIDLGDIANWLSIAGVSFPGGDASGSTWLIRVMGNQALARVDCSPDTFSSNPFNFCMQVGLSFSLQYNLSVALTNVSFAGSDWDLFSSPAADFINSPFAMNVSFSQAVNYVESMRDAFGSSIQISAPVVTTQATSFISLALQSNTSNAMRGGGCLQVNATASTSKWFPSAGKIGTMAGPTVNINSRFLDCSAVSLDGINSSALSGGSLFVADSHLSVNAGTFFFYSHTDGNGGSIAVVSTYNDSVSPSLWPLRLSTQGSIFYGSQANGSGGAIYVNSGAVMSSIDIEVLTVFVETSSNGDGGVFEGSGLKIMFGDFSFTSSFVILSAAYANGNGGAISLTSSTVAKGSINIFFSYFTGCSTVNGSGGAVYLAFNNIGSDILILETQFNNSTSLSGSGGSISILQPTGASSISIQGSNFSSTSCGQYGGAISMNGSDSQAKVALVNNYFEGCMSVGNGGCVSISNINNATNGIGVGFNVTIANSTFTNSQTYASGAAIQIDHIETSLVGVLVKNCTFARNTGLSDNSQGVVSLYDIAGHAGVSNCSFSDGSVGNVAGAVAATAVLEGVDIDTSFFYGNRATGSGGDLYLRLVPSLNIRQCAFNYSYSDDSGGSIAVIDTTNVTIDSSTFQNTQSSGINGGAVHALRLQLFSITSSTFLNASLIGNPFGGGGAVSLIQCDNAEIVFSNFVQCQSSSNGGAIRIESSVIFVYFCSFSGNSVSPSLSSNGAGYSTADISGIGGGAIMAFDHTIMLLEFNTFNSSSSHSHGGAVMVLAGSSLYIWENQFVQNQALGGSGGAIAVVRSSILVVLASNQFTANFAEVHGGAIALAEGSSMTGALFGDVFQFPPSVSSSVITFKQNSANVGWGGAIFCDGQQSDGEAAAGIVIRTELDPAFATDVPRSAWEFVGNSAIRGNGGAIGIMQCTVDIRSNITMTFVNNTAFVNGGAMIIALSNLLKDGVQTSFQSVHDVNGTVMIGNVAKNGNGGALYITGISNIPSAAGAVLTNENPLQTSNENFYSAPRTDVNLLLFECNSYLYNNTAPLGLGGAVFWNADSIDPDSLAVATSAIRINGLTQDSRPCPISDVTGVEYNCIIRMENNLDSLANDILNEHQYQSLTSNHSVNQTLLNQLQISSSPFEFIILPVSCLDGCPDDFDAYTNLSVIYQVADDVLSGKRAVSIDSPGVLDIQIAVVCKNFYGELTPCISQVSDKSRFINVTLLGPASLGNASTDISSLYKIGGTTNGALSLYYQNSSTDDHISSLQLDPESPWQASYFSDLFASNTSVVQAAIMTAPYEQNADVLNILNGNDQTDPPQLAIQYHPNATAVIRLSISGGVTSKISNAYLQFNLTFNVCPAGTRLSGDGDMNQPLTCVACGVNQFSTVEIATNLAYCLPCSDPGLTCSEGIAYITPGYWRDPTVPITFVNASTAPKISPSISPASSSSNSTVPSPSPSASSTSSIVGIETSLIPCLVPQLCNQDVPQQLLSSWSELSSEATNSTAQNTCASSHTGPLCAACVAGYVMASNICVQCPANQYSIIAIVLMIIFTGIYCGYFTISQNLKRKKKFGIARTNKSSGSSDHRNTMDSISSAGQTGKNANAAASKGETHQEELSNNASSVEMLPTGNWSQGRHDSLKPLASNTSLASEGSSSDRRGGVGANGGHAKEDSAAAAAAKEKHDAMMNRWDSWMHDPDIITLIVRIASDYLVVISTISLFKASAPKLQQQTNYSVGGGSIQWTTVVAGGSDLVNVPIDCLLPFLGFYGKWITYLVAPIAASIFAWLIIALHRVYRSKVLKRPVKSSFADAFTACVGQILFLMHSIITRSTFQVIPCLSTSVEGYHPLIADITVSCDTSQYKLSLVVAAFVMLIYIFGIPLFGFYMLYCDRHSKYPEGVNVGARLGFLRDGFKERFYWWELLIVTGRKIAMMFVVVFANNGVQQAQVGLVVLLVALWLQFAFLPFERLLYNYLESASLGISIMFIAMQTIVHYEDSESGTDQWSERSVAVFLSALHYTFLVLLIALAVWGALFNAGYELTRRDSKVIVHETPSQRSAQSTVPSSQHQFEQSSAV